MSRGSAWRREPGLTGQVDAPPSTVDPGLAVKRSPFCAFEEMGIGKVIAVADPFEPEWRRPVVAHAVGPGFPRPGNQPSTRRRTDLGHGFEREAKDFAFGAPDATARARTPVPFQP